MAIKCDQCSNIFCTKHSNYDNNDSSYDRDYDYDDGPYYDSSDDGDEKYGSEYKEAPLEAMDFLKKSLIGWSIKKANSIVDYHKLYWNGILIEYVEAIDDESVVIGRLKVTIDKKKKIKTVIGM
jgi:hypothetical protein